MITPASDVNNPELGEFYAGAIRLFRQFDVQNRINALMRPVFGASYRSVFQEGNATRVKSSYFGDNNQKVVLLDGAETQQQVNGIIAGYTSGQGFAGHEGFNAWYQAAADQVVDMIRSDAVLQRPASVTLVGWSAGGAIGTIVAKKILNEFDFPPRIITFGAPRALSHNDIQPIRTLQCCRWMNDTDPIPLVPPRAEDSPILFLSLRLIDVLRFGSYVHAQGGVSLAPDGTATPSALPEQAAMDPVTSLSTWYFSELTDPNNTHQLPHYQGRLLGLAQQLTPAAPNVDAHQPVEQPQEVRRREFTEAERRTAALVQHRALIQNQVAVDIQRTVLFKAQRVGRMWGVIFGDQLFVWSGNKKRARHLARAGNDFLRSLPKQAIVDPETLLSQMTAFLNAAVVPGGPVNPPINVGL